MNDTFLRRTLSIALSLPLLGLWVPAARADISPGEAGKPQAGIPWLSDLDLALEKARKEAKPVLVDFEADWCGWCKKLDRETYGDERVIRFVREHFIAVKIDTDEHPAVAEKYGVEGLPTILFLSPRGEVLARLQGFRPPEVFLREAAKPAESASRLEELRKAAEEHPEDLAAQRAYARALFAAGNARGAIEVLEKARKRAPRDPGVLLDLASTLHAERRLEEAREVYEELLALPDGGEAAREARFPLARLLISTGRHREAVALLDRLLAAGAAGDERLQALFLRGYAKAALKDAAGAIADLKAARELAPDSPWGLRAAYILDIVEAGS